ncbi:MAG TPA: ABC transporter substrate-binding protein [Stellaceae bacterium]|nr:ABC transporter substrate-binding protein [Stellaceae bacterium]
MTTSRRTVLKYSAGLAAVGLMPRPALAEVTTPIRIGVLYDLSGPFAAAGSIACRVGAQTAVDLTNERGGVMGKYKVEAVTADSQSKADVAINEADRLISQEKLDIILGVYSSAHAVPLAEKLDQQKKILWITTATSTAVLKGKNRQYTFRTNVHTDQYGGASSGFVGNNAKAKLGMEPKDVKVAIIHEDGPYGTGCGDAAEANSKKLGMQVVLKEAYSSNAPDLSSLVTKLRRARADAILHAGYNPDITLFLRQGREAGLRFKVLIGHGAGYSQLDKLRDTFKSDIDYFCNVDPAGGQLINPGAFQPGVSDLIKIMVERFIKQTNIKDVPPHCSMGFGSTWTLLNSVMPIAIQKFGGVDAEAIRKAALEVDIPPGGTVQGFGVKFAAPGSELAGQNERSVIAVMQYFPTAPEERVVGPDSFKTNDPVVPLPNSSPYAMT